MSKIVDDFDDAEYDSFEMTDEEDEPKKGKSKKRDKDRRREKESFLFSKD